MPCELLDLRCIFVSELIGSVVLATIIIAILYFIVAAKLRWGFDTTIAFSIPFLLILGLAITGFSIIFATATVLVSLLLAWLLSQTINK